MVVAHDHVRVLAVFALRNPDAHPVRVGDLGDEGLQLFVTHGSVLSVPAEGFPSDTP